jgi:hypothetical protein
VNFAAILVSAPKASERGLDGRSNGPEPNDGIGQRMLDGLAHSFNASKQVLYRVIYSREPRPDPVQPLFERFDDHCRFFGSSF